MDRLLDFRGLPVLAGGICALGLVAWLGSVNVTGVAQRVPGADARPEAATAEGKLPQLKGKLTTGDGSASEVPGMWPQFRGPSLSAISDEDVPLSRDWGTAGPPVLWELSLGEGFAGAAVRNGCVYLIDYDRDKAADVVRCLSLNDGREIWSFSYPVKVKRNHGMSRTIPSVTDEVVVTLGPKCHLTCLDAKTGERKWALDLVQQFGTKVPEWYAGQCPLIDDGRLIIAPAGSALLAALDLDTGESIWETPNPKGWAMTHSSITPMDLDGRRTYIYCAKKGVVGVSAEDGGLLWETEAWKISMATIASPVVIGESRVFLAGGYNSGALMLEIKPEGETYSVAEAFRLKPGEFGAEEHTPILHRGHLFGVRPNGEMTCLGVDGTIKWTSGASLKFGLGPFMIADGMILALDDDGMLTAMEATTSGCFKLTQAKVLEGPDAWAPMALVGGHLLVRDMNRMVCLDLRG